MAKNKQQANTALPKTIPSTHQNSKGIATKNIFNHPNTGWAIAGIIAGIVFLVFKTSLYNQFTNWDDPNYITDNPLITSLSPAHIKSIFTVPVMGNYHPLTILSYAIDYYWVQLAPFEYHVHSLVLHILVGVLVYWLAYLLTQKHLIAIITSLLFGLHPMHVESVAWLSGRKDLLCGLFYFAACIAYLYFIKAIGIKKWALYIGIFLFSIAAMLSKPVAVVLPFTLLLFDYWQQRQLTLKLIYSKLPLLGIALLLGIKALTDQSNTGAIKTTTVVYNIIERIELGSYALFTYLWKAIIPAGLSSFYNYPARVNEALPMLYLLLPIGIIASVYVLWRFCRHNKMLVFGSLFFIINIALLLQFIPVGDAIIAERYTYIPYFGLFLVEGWLIATLISKVLKYQYLILALVAVYIGVLGWVSNERCNVWYDSTTLWRSVLDTQPQTPVALNNLGALYFDKYNAETDKNQKKTDEDSAYLLLRQAIDIDPNYVSPYTTLGMLEAYNNRFDVAKQCLYKALYLHHTQDMATQAYLVLSTIYLATKNYDSARYCNANAIFLNTNYPGVHLQYGKYFSAIGKLDTAIKEYNIAIAQNQIYYEGYLWKGEALFALQMVDSAIVTFNTAIALNPQHGELFYNRSVCYYTQGNKTKALQDIQQAQALGITQIDPAYLDALNK